MRRIDFLDRIHIVIGLLTIWKFIQLTMWNRYWITSYRLGIGYSLLYNNITIQSTVYDYNSIIE